MNVKSLHTLAFFATVALFATIVMAQPKMLPSPTDNVGPKEIKIEAESPLWSPDGTKIAFARVSRDTGKTDPNFRLLCVVDASTGNNIEILAGLSYLPRNFCWSPDGTKLAFVECTSDGGNIYTIDLATKTKTKLTDSKEHPDNDYLHLAWSPDGTKIAFTIRQRYSYGQHDCYIWIVDSQGKFWFKLVKGHMPMWVPDSEKIIFSAGSIDIGEGDFHIIDSNGKNLKKVEYPESLPLRGFTNICLSPDSQTAFYTNGYEIHATKPNEGQPTATEILAGRSGVVSDIVGIAGTKAAGIKDGTVSVIDLNKLVAARKTKSKEKLPKAAIVAQFKVENLSSGNGQELRMQGSTFYRPLWAWSPDGKQAVYVGTDNELWKIGADGKNQKQLTFEKTRLVEQAKQEQKKQQALADAKLDATLSNK